jgi:hypothetical protein
MMKRPGLRNRLVFSHEAYTTGAPGAQFSAAFCENIHFHWPFPDQDIMEFDQVTKTYHLSSVFEMYASNVDNWTMDAGWFKLYPEMRDDIPMTMVY